jgi:hypothetical protein
MITQVKWNKGIPGFKEVENKTILVKRKDGVVVYSEKIVDRIQIQPYDCIDSFAILSDEEQVCEWKKNILDVYQGGCTSMVIGYNDWWKFCPHCGNPIHIVDELKPLPLMGIEPVINVTLGVYQCVWENFVYTISSLADTKKVHAIESWNSLVKKLTGEK